MESPHDNPVRLRLRVAVKLLTAVAVLAAAGMALDYLGGGPPASAPAVTRFAVADVAPGEVRRLLWNGRPVIVLRRRAERGWLVVFASARATGCPLAWQAAAGRFVDPCSGTRYDDHGRPLDAPGPAPLRQPPHHFDTVGRLVLGRE